MNEPAAHVPSSPTPTVGFGVLGLHEGLTLIRALGETDAGSTHIGALRRTEHARAVAGCDLRPEKRTAALEANPALFVTDDYAAMLERADVEVVAIYTPDALHAGHIVQALEAGKHVLVTKPIVTTLEDGRRVLETARRTGGRVMVGQSTRFFEPFLRQRAAFERGEIGALELLEAQYTHRMDWYYRKSPWVAAQTDWVFLGLSHPVDLARWYLGRIETVQAFGARSALGREHGVAGFDLYSVNLRGSSGALGRVMGHYGLHELPSARNAIELVLYGTDGTSQAQYHDMRYRHTASDGTEVLEDSLYAKRAYYFNQEVHGMHYGEFANYAEHYATAILNGTPHQPDLKHALETLCVMEAARRSAVGGGQTLEVAPLLQAVGLLGG
jgi:predicted dehydrogenase